MGFASVDGYLLGDPISKEDAVAEFLATRSSDPAAAPFYRALEAVGARAADEALIALRLVLAKREPSDAGVKRIRALAAVAKAAAGRDRAALAKLLKRDAAVLADLDTSDPPSIAGAARSAYARELAQEA
jgi:hypothetical protein